MIIIDNAWVPTRGFRGFVGLIGLLALMMSMAAIGAERNTYRLQAASPAGTYAVDPLHSTAFFTIGHLGISEFRGRFDKVSGRFTFDPSRPDQDRVVVEVPIESLDTDYARRNKDLLGPDFFNAKQFPVMRFVSKNYRPNGRNGALLSGDLTLHGVTRPVTFEIHHVGAGPDPWGGYRSGYTASAVIKRSNFGMRYMLGDISDQVRITVNIEGIRK